MTMFQSFVLSPKSVWICWAEDPQYWRVSPMQNSRFSQKAELLDVCWLQIRGTFDTAILDKDTTYSVLRKVHLNPGSPDLIKQEGEEWLALEVGKFQPAKVSREITANLLDGTTHWKTGLVFAGVEIRAVSA
ncbi:hypothetical protein EJ110_NYTH41025 [Nymphaea thermarum]|nr:hypothetical protein EJ110_NYTH41025 [Nymphaea thermarum]